MREINIGILGSGKITRKFCDAAAMTSGVRVVAAASMDSERSKALAQEKNIPDFYCGYDTMLERDDIDLIYVATTHNFHYENIRLCLSHGKHVLCEKSMVPSRAEAQELFGMAKVRGLLLAEAMWVRYLPAISAARELIASGEIGEIACAYSVAGFRGNRTTQDRLFNPALGGGAALDIGVYAVEVMAYLVGDNYSCASVRRVDDANGVDMTDHIRLDYEGFSADLLTTLVASPENFLTVTGTKGYIRMPRYIGASEFTLFRDSREPETLRFPYENGFQFELADAAQLIRDGKTASATVPPEMTLRCAGVFDKIFGR